MTHICCVRSGHRYSGQCMNRQIRTVLSFSLLMLRNTSLSFTMFSWWSSFSRSTSRIAVGDMPSPSRPFLNFFIASREGPTEANTEDQMSRAALETNLDVAYWRSGPFRALGRRLRKYPLQSCLEIQSAHGPWVSVNPDVIDACTEIATATKPTASNLVTFLKSCGPVDHCQQRSTIHTAQLVHIISDASADGGGVPDDRCERTQDRPRRSLSLLVPFFLFFSCSF